MGKININISGESHASEGKATAMVTAKRPEIHKKIVFLIVFSLPVNVPRKCDKGSLRLLYFLCQYQAVSTIDMSNYSAMLIFEICFLNILSTHVIAQY